ncbi:MAG: APC family permease [Candidatus Dormibacteria bacterium]
MTDRTAASPGEQSPVVGATTPKEVVELDAENVRELRALGTAWKDVPRARTLGRDGAVDPDLDQREVRGSRPDHRYVRVSRGKKQGFERVAPGWLQATQRATVPATSFGRFRRRVRSSVLGAPLTTSQLSHERLTKVKALAVLSSDALSSVAYATEAVLGVLVLANPPGSALGDDLAIGFGITTLLLFVALSYRQTIKAYPKGGGSYIVAKDNLGPVAGLTAASALMTGYVLTVAVSVASGMDQVQSAFPASGTYRVEICVGLIVLIMLGNLRGIKESGSIFAAPTYLFIASMFLMIGTLAVRGITHSLVPHGTAPFPARDALQNAGIFLVLRAFASGCTALTGVEAISDGVPAFHAPEWRNARTTLTVMASILGTMFVGITIAAHVLHLRPWDSADKRYESIIAQLAAHAYGNGSILYIVTAVATTGILVLAPNTSFSDFPRLFFFLSRDDYAPHQFRRLGDRLAFSNGILVLGGLSVVIEIVFQGKTTALLPLYAAGVFLAFTMSQAGMVVRWLKRREPGWQRGLPLNAAGMTSTAIVFVVFGVTKFTSGAWVVLVIIPFLVMIFRAVHSHYTDAGGHLATEIGTSPSALNPVCIVPLTDLNPLSMQSLAMARTISDNVIAVHVCDDEHHIGVLRAKWQEWGNYVPLEIIESPYRSLIRPLLAYINAIDRQRDDDTIVIVLPELVATRWWHNLLHNQTALRLKAAFLFRKGTVLVSVPYHLHSNRRVSRARRARDAGAAEDDSL